MRCWLLFAVALAWAGPALGEETSGAAGKAAERIPGPEDFCVNFADQANEARVAWQQANLEKLQAELDGKIVALEAKKVEVEQWMGKRQAMLNAAGQELVAIYAKMDPEAAARQLAQIDLATATALLRRLSPRGASAILNEMDAPDAARLAKSIAKQTVPAAGEDGS